MTETSIQKSTSKRVHRIGSITFGTSLIVFGILFLLHMLMPAFNYEFIFRLWPCILIILGLEVLVGNYREGVTFIYDKTAIFLIIVLSFFSMLMALADFLMQNHPEFYL